LTLAEARLYNGQVIRYFPDKKLGEGSEKEFFASEDENFVIGFYLNENEGHDPERIKRLTSIIEKYNPTLDSDKGDFWKRLFCWPEAIVVKPRVGILSPRFPSQYYFSDSKGEKKGTWFSKERLMKRLKKEERGDWFSRFQICRQLARTVGRMHIAGLAHSDLSGNNVLMSPSDGTCILIDIDSLVVPGIYPSKVLGTSGYMAPEVVMTSQLPLKHPDKKLPSIKTDLHSLAVIIYELLLLRHPLQGRRIYSEDTQKDDLLRFGEKAVFIEHPSDSSNRTDKADIPMESLGHLMTPLFLKAFTQGLHHPDKRPTAYEWESCLNHTADMLYPCKGQDCQHKWFVCRKGRLVQCPFCGWKPSDSVPVMHLFRKYKTGQYVSENRYMAIWDKKKLYARHTRSDISADMPDNPGCEGSFMLKGQHWTFRNESSENRMCSVSEQIMPGNSMGISDKKTLLLSDHPKGRLAVFEFLPVNA